MPPSLPRETPVLEPGAARDPVAPWVPSPRRWWSPRRGWLPLALLIAILAAGTFATVRLAGERHDIRTEIAATRQRTRELQPVVRAAAEQIAELEDEAQDDLAIGRDCTLAAQTGVEVLGALIRALELTERGEVPQAQTEGAEMERLAKEADRAAVACASGFPRSNAEPSDGEVVV